jgi:hypothetical protein
MGLDRSPHLGDGALCGLAENLGKAKPEGLMSVAAPATRTI